MTKKELELENKFLKLQLETIAKWVKTEPKDASFPEILGHIEYITEFYKKNLNFIKEYDLEYNFFNK